MSMKNKQPVRFAVIGSSRGKSFAYSASKLGGAAVLTAVCDNNLENLKQWKHEYGDSIKTYSDYQQVLNDPDIDAVCVATPLTLHARQSIDAIRAGKHVLSEVIAATTIEECWELVEAVRNSDRTYMMAENYCFMEPNMQVWNMVQQGVFGDLVYASGAYLHDVRHMQFHPDGSLTWRGGLGHTYYGNTYPTHSLGPVACWLGVNRTDRMTHTATWQSKSVAPQHYARRFLSDRPEYQQKDFWKRPDTVTTSIRTENEVLIDLRVDWVSARPHNMNRYELQGTKASFYWTDGSDPMIWIEGRSGQGACGEALEWESLWKYRDEFEHPWWKRQRDEANRTGHGGGDHFVLQEFVTAIHEGREPILNVYDAVSWSSIFPLSMLSIDRNNASVEIPDFKNGHR